MEYTEAWLVKKVRELESTLNTLSGSGHSGGKLTVADTDAVTNPVTSSDVWKNRLTGKEQIAKADLSGWITTIA